MPMRTPEEQRKYQREWLRKRRHDWIQKNGPCQHCHSWNNLQVDHVDPHTKSMQPAAIWSRSESVRNKELAKCQVLCMDCHRIKTTNDAHFVRGESHPSSTLSEDDVLFIRSSSLTQRELAEMFGVGGTCISKVKRRERWTHI